MKWIRAYMKQNLAELKGEIHSLSTVVADINSLTLGNWENNETENKPGYGRLE